MTDMQIPPADTSDLARMHRVFREALAAAPALVGNAPTDAERVTLVASYYANVLDLLDVHHDSEDTLITPLLQRRCSPEDVAAIDRVAQQHEPVHTDLAEAQAALTAWQAAPNADTASAAVVALTALDASLTAHLDDEEATMVPLAAVHLNAAEWGQMPSHGMAAFKGDKVWLIIGLIREQMTPEQRAMMESHMPPPVAQMWTTSGQSMFTEFVSKLRQT